MTDKKKKTEAKLDATERQRQLDNISPEELAKVEAHQAKTKKTIPVDDEWLLLVEFTRAFGWEAYRAVINDEIDTPRMHTMIEANRKLEARDLLNRSVASFIGSGSAQSKSPSKTFKSLIKSIIKQTKADEF